MRTCPACRAENAAESRFCKACGAALLTVCQACGDDLSVEARFCPACGAAAGTDVPLSGEERKVVTILFADLVDSTAHGERLDPEDVRAILSPYFALLRSELERFGGTVEKFIGDAVMALFGAPLAHEDDPERAVRAALAIRDGIAELNEPTTGLDLHLRIAVNTGEAVVTLGAQPGEGEGMAAGDVVNTCSRLQAAAPVDGILVGEATYRATADAIEYRPARPVQAKGKTEEVPVWEPIAVRRGEERLTRQAPLVGRRHELNLLLEGVVRARRERTPQFVSVVGVPGIGKSRLVRELLAALEAEPQPATLRLGRCVPYGENVTFTAVAEMVKAQAGILTTDNRRGAEAKLHTAVALAVSDGAEAEWVESHLRPLAGLAGAGRLRGDRRDEAFAAWRRFFESLAEEHALVLVFEDLHWADEGLLDFVDHLVDWASEVPLLVLCTGRPELHERRPGWGGGKPNATTISLTPLSNEETAQLVAALLEQGSVLPAEVQGPLLAQAGGNPLYAEEYTRMLVDRGFLWRNGGGWQLATDDLPLPESVQGIIAARLDALPAGEKLLLQSAAVVGKSFWLGALTTIAGMPRSLVEERLHALERKEFVRRDRHSSVAGEVEHAFRHVLVRDVAYAQIPRVRRAKAHRAAAEWLESLAADREEQAELLAHHYLSALEFARAAGHPADELMERTRIALRAAGDRALTLNSYSAATRLYGKALELWPHEDPARPQLLFCYGKALGRARQEGADVLAEARDGLLAAGDRETAAEADVMLGELTLMQGDRDHASEHFLGAVALLENAPPSRSKAYVLSNLSRYLMIADENEQAIRVGFDAMQMADELGLEEMRAHALNNIGVARVEMGDPGGIVDLEQSLAIAVQINSPESVRSYLNLSSTIASLGDLQRAFGLSAKGRRAAERFGDVGGIRWFSAERIYEHYWTGRWDETVTLADQLITEVAGGQPHRMEFDALLGRTWVRLGRGEIDGAADDSARFLEFARETAKDPQSVFPAIALRARVLVSAGQEEEAAGLVTELLDDWTETGGMLASFWTADLAFVLSALGRGDELAETAAAAKMPTRWLEAAKAYAGGEFERAADLYCEIGTLPDEAFARLRAAEALVALGRRSEADLQLRRALAFYRRIAATAYVREGEALLLASA